ncbi:hypothetical protein CMUS01_04154 [Colletotrichum musicola]|uniref:Uncharacterized protein n=1 Tax=Colletotrichum musicola TaxID=2175873 RepID=A0A8H6NNU9_9PEZI|nr:hypothetical protein CMUS01_04154 [Colletotrichum musicola]
MLLPLFHSPSLSTFFPPRLASGSPSCNIKHYQVRSKPQRPRISQPFGRPCDLGLGGGCDMQEDMDGRLKSHPSGGHQPDENQPIRSQRHAATVSGNTAQSPRHAGQCRSDPSILLFMRIPACRSTIEMPTGLIPGPNGALWASTQLGVRPASMLHLGSQEISGDRAAMDPPRICSMTRSRLSMIQGRRHPFFLRPATSWKMSAAHPGRERPLSAFRYRLGVGFFGLQTATPAQAPRESKQWRIRR